jgi:glucuronate isomerase
MSRDPDRLLPEDPATRGIARELYERVRNAPIVSPHGHVDPALLVADEPFADAAELLVRPDHYVTRMLVAAGCDVPALAAGPPEQLWRAFVEHRRLFAGTATGYWLDDQLAGLFDVDLERDGADTAYAMIAARLAEPALRPRALLQGFRVAALATTDDPLDDLDVHRRARTALPGVRLLPTFRPDRFIDPEHPGFPEAHRALVAHAGIPGDDLGGYLDALAARRAHFIAEGAISADHGMVEPYSADLDAGDAQRLFARVVSGAADAVERRELHGYLLLQMGLMSARDGLVMTLHVGVLRNHSAEMLHRAGPDSGHDIPVPTTFTRGLRPLLARVGLDPEFHLVLFTVDESAWARELAPLAGFYPSVYVGAPWWFLDAPDAIQRYRSAVTETAGFYRSSGFVDDARALASLGTRHDMARRLDAGFLARLVRQGRLTGAAAERIADDLVDSIPRGVFKL